MKTLSSLLVILGSSLALLTGCATKVQPPVRLAATSISFGAPRIGIVMAQMPQTDTYLPGANCLLCMAAASLANSSLTSYAHTLPRDEFAVVKQSFADVVQQRGAVPVLIAEDIRLEGWPELAASGDRPPLKDFSSLQKKYGLDKLLLVDIRQIGFERSYSSYIPNGDPKGVLRGSGSLVDLKTNTLDWYLPLAVMRSADGPWDEPPKFPGLTNAYFQVIEAGKDALLEQFRP